LTQLDQLLEDDTLFQRVKADLLRRAPHTAARGRPSTPVEVILRMLVVKRLYHWSYEETEHLVADSLGLNTRGQPPPEAASDQRDPGAVSDWSARAAPPPDTCVPSQWWHCWLMRRIPMAKYPSKGQRGTPNPT
jgi:hypothetical protein